MTIIDVRTPAEFSSGHVTGSVNIPLIEIEKHVDQIRSMSSPVILCCASGLRSARATEFLKSCGIDCSNGGGWHEISDSKK